MVVLSIVIPIYNEAGILEKNIETVVKYMEKLDFSYEIIIAEDGSTDGSDKIADELSKKFETVKASHLKGRAGRGMGLKRAFLNSKGKILMYFDVDLSTEIRNIEKAVKIVKSSCDICIGSRLLPRSKTERCLKREIASRRYNLFSRILFGSKISDLQCGFKTFKRSTLPILLRGENNHWLGYRSID